MQHRWCAVASSSSSSRRRRRRVGRPPGRPVGRARIAASVMCPARSCAVSAILPPFLVLAPPPPCAKFRLPPCPPWGLMGLLGSRNSWSQGPCKCRGTVRYLTARFVSGPSRGRVCSEQYLSEGAPSSRARSLALGVASCCCVGYSAWTLWPVRVVALPPPAPSTLNQDLKL